MIGCPRCTPGVEPAIGSMAALLCDQHYLMYLNGQSVEPDNLDVTAMLACIVRLHAEGTLSEGQACKATGLPRIELRRLADAHLVERG